MINYSQILKYPRLSVEEEIELTQLYADTKDKKVLDKLTKANLRFVLSVAKQYYGINPDMTIDDLFIEGSIGLVKGIEKFDPTRGFKLISYSVWWIRNHIMASLHENEHIRKPLNIIAIGNKIKKFNNKFEAENGCLPNNKEISDGLGYAESRVLSATTVLNSGVVTIDSVGDEDFNLLDHYVVENDTSTQETIDEAQWLLGLLTDEREKLILKYYLGLEGVESMNFNEIGLLLGITGTTVNNTYKKTIQKLRAKTKLIKNRGVVHSYVPRMEKENNTPMKQPKRTYDMTNVVGTIDQDIIRDFHGLEGREEKSFKEIGDNLGVPTSLIKKRYSKAMKMTVVEVEEPVKEPSKDTLLNKILKWFN